LPSVSARRAEWGWLDLSWSPRRFTSEIVLGAEEPFYGIIHERPIVLEAIIILNALVYIVTSYANGFIASSSTWISKLGYIPAMLLVDPKTVYRIFTAMFTHADIFHIFFNMYFLYVFGRAVEKTLGHARFLALYLMSGVLAAIFHTVFIYLQNPADLAIPSVGASGAISGVLGAYMLLYPGTRLTACFFLFIFPLCFEMLAAYYILFWFAVQVLEGSIAFNSNIAFFAHAGGFLAGIALLPLVADRERLRILKRLSRSMRLFDIITFLSYQFERRGLSPGTKTVFLTLAGVLLAGTMFAYIYSASHQGLLAAYTVDWRLGPETGSGMAFVGIVDSHAYPILMASTPQTQLVMSLLSEYRLFYNPSLAGQKLVLTPPLARPVDVTLFATLYTRFTLHVEPRVIEAVFTPSGVLREAYIEAIVVGRGSAALIADVVLNALANPVPLLRLMSLISLVTVALSIYVVAYRDTEFVVTPE